MTIAIYCGASSGASSEYREASEQLGGFFAQQGIDIVYGGGQVGLMGAVANTALASGGKVYGIIPRALADRELAHGGLSRLEIVDDMHQRKARMAELADAFLALPGGAGTMEEIFEAWTWAQLGYHQKPCGLYNIGNYYQPLVDMVTHMTKEGFIRKEYAEMLFVCRQPQEVLKTIASYRPPSQKWS